MSAVWEWLFSNEPIHWVQQLFGLGHPLPFRILSLLGDTWGIVLVAGVGLWLFGRKTLAGLIGIIATGAASKLLLLDLVQQSRPEGSGIVVYEHLEMSSFPSGHVYATVGPWGLLYATGRVPLWVPVTATLGVGLGRIYLGTHYLGDVLGGIVLGVLLVWAFARVWPTVWRWLRRRGGRLRLAVAAGVAVATVAVLLSTENAHARRYEIYGLVLAAAIALPLEGRWLRYDPGERSSVVRAGQVFLGLLGIAACLLWDRSRPEDALLLGTLTAGLATCWALLIAPALFVGAGIAQRAPDAREILDAAAPKAAHEH